MFEVAEEEEEEEEEVGRGWHTTSESICSHGGVWLLRITKIVNSGSGIGVGFPHHVLIALSLQSQRLSYEFFKQSHKIGR
jgi:hypothetical protein